MSKLYSNIFFDVFYYLKKEFNVNISKFGKIAILSGAVAGSVCLGTGVSKTVRETNQQVKEYVRLCSPKKYAQIMNSDNPRDLHVWNQALHEVTDSIAKLNSQCQKAYFEADTLVNKSVKTAVKSVR